jgi:hypothetical protein
VGDCRPSRFIAPREVTYGIVDEDLGGSVGPERDGGGCRLTARCDATTPAGKAEHMADRSSIRLETNTWTALLSIGRSSYSSASRIANAVCGSW